MGTFSAILGGIGGLSAVMGIVVALGIIKPVINYASLAWTFWLALAAVLLLGAIAVKPNAGE
jgi:hypothetical protein